MGHWYLPLNMLCVAAALGTVCFRMFHPICRSCNHFSGVHPDLKKENRRLRATSHLVKGKALFCAYLCAGFLMSVAPLLWVMPQMEKLC